MFNIVKAPALEQCAARRCQETDVEAVQGTISLCARHLTAWVEAGEPTFTPVAAPAPKASTELVPAQEKEALAQEQAAAEETLELIKGLPIDTQDSVDMLGALGLESRAKIETLDERRKLVTRPLNQALKAANAMFKPAIHFYEDCVKVLNGKLIEAQALGQAEQDAALEAVEAAGGHVDDTTLVVAHNPVELPAGASTRDVPAFTITDEGLVPREFMSPDPAKLKIFAAAALAEGITSAPGLEFHYDQSLTQRKA